MKLKIFGNINFLLFHFFLRKPLFFLTSSRTCQKNTLVKKDVKVPFLTLGQYTQKIFPSPQNLMKLKISGNINFLVFHFFLRKPLSFLTSSETCQKNTLVKKHVKVPFSTLGPYAQKIFPGPQNLIDLKISGNINFLLFHFFLRKLLLFFTSSETCQENTLVKKDVKVPFSTLGPYAQKFFSGPQILIDVKISEKINFLVFHFFFRKPLFFLRSSGTCKKNTLVKKDVKVPFSTLGPYAQKIFPGPQNLMVLKTFGDIKFVFFHFFFQESLFCLTST